MQAGWSFEIQGARQHSCVNSVGAGGDGKGYRLQIATRGGGLERQKSHVPMLLLFDRHYFTFPLVPSRYVHNRRMKKSIWIWRRRDSE